MFSNIPLELRELKQWVCWRLEFRPPMLKPTKVPYIARPGCGKADVMKADTWSTFEEAISAPLLCIEPVDPDKPVSQTGFTGIGFVFKVGGKYCGLDFDDAHGDAELYAKHQELFKRFNSYSELSPSGKGIHIIVKGELERGRRRNGVELYPHSRFFTMTGNVYHNVPIAERQKELDILFAAMGGKSKEFEVKPDAAQTEEDQIIIDRATNAVNGEKFLNLWEGRWQSLYSSQSEADFALVDIIAFYTKYIPQIVRLFRTSALGQRDKAQRDDYVNYMVEKSFDRQLPPIDIDGLKIALDNAFRDKALAGVTSATEPGGSSEEAPNSTASAASGREATAGEETLAEVAGAVNPFPTGLLGELAQYFYDVSPRPAHDLALAGAIGFMSGLCGRAYNTETGAGLNQYILMLAATGTGKDAVSKASSRLIEAIRPSVPTIIDIRGPGEMASAPGLIKWLGNKPCVFSIVGEFGEKLKEMASPNASSHLTGLSRCLLQMYSKSGHNEVFDPMAYSDRDKNTAPIKSPTLTLFGESVPESFYEAMDETMIGKGLLPRFMIFEYLGKRSYFNKHSNDVVPSLDMITRLADIAGYCFGTQHRQTVHVIDVSPAANKIFNELDIWTTDVINSTNGGEVVNQLWNRVHLQALKLSSLLAVCDNYLAPMVSVDHATWAINLIVGQTKRLLAKFETGQVGQAAATGEGRQLQDLCKTFKDFTQDFNKYSKYLGRKDMFDRGIITESCISRKLQCLAAFKHDRMGATNAIKRAVKALLDADDIVEIPKMQMKAMFGTGPRAFQIANPARFI